MLLTNRLIATVLGATIAGINLTGGAAQAETVTFDPGTYYLAYSNLGPVVDTLTVTVIGGVATFDLTGADSALFTVSSPSTPAGDYVGNPYYIVTPSTANWDTISFPDLTFWYTTSDGGLTVGSQPGDQGTNFIDLYQSTPGTGQVFNNATPLPSTWTMLIAGFVGLGFLAYRGTKKNAAVAAA